MKKTIFILLVCVFVLGLAVTTSQASSSVNQTNTEKIYVGASIGSLESEYWASLAKGAELFVDSLPEGAAEFVVMTSLEPDKQISNIESFITTYGENGVLFIDPRNVAVTVTITEMCEEAGVKFVLYSGLEEGLYPTNYENFVAFITQDDVNSGYLSAKALFDSIGGKGKVAELYGILGSDPSFKRNAGLMKALEEYPDIELVDSQVANHVASEALAVTENWIAAYGEDLNAIYCHSDTMAVAAAEALKQAGLAGKVHVAGFDGTAAAFDCIKDGSMYSTILNDGYLVGGYAAAYAYAARVGTIDTKTMDQTKRMFYSKIIQVTKDNVDEMVSNYIDSTPIYNFENLDYPIDAIIDNPSLK
ncbi:MAG: sugar ABC transporter substrate-binding protein [Flexilinea sp.]